METVDPVAGVEPVDVVVLGAGVVGLAVARALALRGRSVWVLEREAGIDMGTPARATAATGVLGCAAVSLHLPRGQLHAYAQFARGPGAALAVW